MREVKCLHSQIPTGNHKADVASRNFKTSIKNCDPPQKTNMLCCDWDIKQAYLSICSFICLFIQLNMGIRPAQLSEKIWWGF